MFIFILRCIYKDYFLKSAIYNNKCFLSLNNFQMIYTVLINKARILVI